MKAPTTRVRDIRALALGLTLSAAAFPMMSAAVQADDRRPGMFDGWYVDGEWVMSKQKQPTATDLADFGGGRLMGRMLYRLDPVFVGGGYHTGLLTNELGVVQFDGNRGRFFVFGQLNVAFIDIDNENPASDNSYLATNWAGPTHLGVGAEYELNKEWAVGGRLSFALAFNRTDINNDFADDAGCDERDAERRKFCVYDANLYLTSRYGTLTGGYLETAFSGIGGINLGGTGHVTNNDPTIKVGFHEAWGTGREFGFIAPEVTGVTRAAGLRYDSPSFAGFVFSASFGDAEHVGAPFDAEDYWDVAIRYAGEFGGFRVAAGVGYQEYDRDVPGWEQSNVTVSGSLFHVPTGLYVSPSFSGLTRDAPTAPSGVETDDADAYYVQFGIRQIWLDFGNTTLYGEFGGSDSSADNGDYFRRASDTSNFGLGVVQDIDRAAMALYLSYNNVEADFAGSSAEDIDVIMGGARVKF